MNKERVNDIDVFFRDNLYDFEMEVPAGIFGRIEQQVVEKRRRRLTGYFYITAASVAMLIALGTGYFAGIKSTDIESYTNVVSSESTKTKTLKIEENNVIKKESKATYTYEAKTSKIAKVNKSQLVSISVATSKNVAIIQNKEEKAVNNISTSKLQTTSNTSFRSSKMFSCNSFTIKHVATIKSKQPEGNAAFAQQQLEKSITSEFKLATWQKKLKIESGSPISHSNQMAYMAPVGTSYANVPSNDVYSSTLRSAGANLGSYFLTADKSSASLSAGSPSNNFTSTTTTPSHVEQTNVKVSYLEVPVTGHYQLVKQTVTVSVSGGVSTMVPYSINSNMGILGNGNAGNSNSRNYRGIIGLSLQLPVYHNLNFSMEPVLHYPISMGGSDAGTFRFYSGLKYSF